MRKTDKEIKDRTAIDAIINNCLVCRIALCKDNRPYIVPVSFGYDGSSLYIHTAKDGLKIDYINSNSNVCFEFEQNVELHKNDKNACSWTFDYESVIGFGVISELTDSKEKAEGLNIIMEHYSGKSWDFNKQSIEGTRVWKIEIESATGKLSSHKTA